MSRSRHPRKAMRRYSYYRVNAKEWKGDSTWKPAERRAADVQERRSSRKRSGDSGDGARLVGAVRGRPVAR